MKVQHYIGTCAVLCLLFTSTVKASSEAMETQNQNFSSSSAFSNLIEQAFVESSRPGWLVMVKDYLEENSINGVNFKDYDVAKKIVYDLKSICEFKELLSSFGLVDRVLDLSSKNGKTLSLAALLQARDQAHLRFPMELEAYKKRLFTEIYESEIEFIKDQYMAPISDLSDQNSVNSFSDEDFFYVLSVNGLSDSLVRIAHKYSEGFESESSLNCLREPAFLLNKKAVQSTISNLNLALFLHATASENGDVMPLPSLMRKSADALNADIAMQISKRNDVILKILTEKATARNRAAMVADDNNADKNHLRIPVDTSPLDSIL